MFNKFFESDIFFLNAAQLQYVKLQDLSGKTVVIDRLDSKNEEILREKNVKSIYPCLPSIHEKYFNSYTKLEALFQCLKEETSPLEKEEIETFINQFDLAPKEVSGIGDEDLVDEVERFAFIIHPLDKMDLLKIPCLKKVRNNETLANALMKISPLIPSFLYGRITGIESAFDGTKVEGDIYTVTEPPQTMLAVLFKKCTTNF